MGIFEMGSNTTLNAPIPLMRNSKFLFYNQSQLQTKIQRYDVIDLFRTSIEEVFSQNFGLETKPCETFPKKEGYTASIPFSDGTTDFEAEVWIDEPALKEMANILLFEENPDPETLEDLTSEVANFIVGHAKMVASDRNLPYRMETPVFTGRRSLEKRGETLLYSVDDRCIAIQLKERNG